MRFSRARFQKVCADYDERWKELDATLCHLCKKNPSHQSKGVINAKLWIIGRAYATGIERKITSKRTQGSSLEQLSDHFWRNRDDVDGALAKVRGLREPLTPDKLNIILDAHGQLACIVQRVLRKGQTPHSFASKYLHFHNPVVPIYDTFAVGAARKYYRRERANRSVQIPGTADQAYVDFIMRFWRLYQEARKSGAKVSVKLLDNYLLALAKKAK